MWTGRTGPLRDGPEKAPPRGGGAEAPGEAKGTQDRWLVVYGTVAKLPAPELESL